MNARASTNIPAKTSDSKPFQNYLLVSIVLLCVGVSITIVQYKVPSVLEDVMLRFSMSPSAGSWLMSIFTAMGIFLSLPTGSLAKKIGPRRILLLGCGIIVIGSIVGALATQSIVLVLSRGIEGIAFVFITVAGPLIIEQYISPERQGAANGIWSLWICLGSVIGSTATPMVLEALGFTGAWLAYAVIVVITSIVFCIAIRRRDTTPHEPITTTTNQADAKPYLELLKPNTLLYFFGYLVFNIEILAILSYTPTFLQSQGMNASLSGFASSLPGLIAIVSALAFGFAIDKTGKSKPLYVIALAATAPATFLMLTQTGPFLWVGAALIGFIGYGAPVACLSSLPQIAASKEAMPTAVGVLMLVQCLGEFMGSFITPILLGPNMNEWLFCGIVMGMLGVAGAAAIAACRFE